MRRFCLLHNGLTRILQFVLIALIATIVLPGASWAQSLPMITDGASGTPDWSKITFSSLPAIDRPGAIIVPEEATQGLGYQVSRSWNAGTPVSQVLKLGDIQEATNVGNTSYGAVLQAAGLDPSATALSNFSFLQNQTIASLINLVPDLGQVPLANVKPFADLVSQKFPQQFQALSGVTIGQLPIEIQQIPINTIDLSQYSLNQIPALDAMQIAAQPDWQNQTIAQTPGLDQVPFARFSNLIGAAGQYLGILAIHDVTYGGNNSHKESTRTPTKFSITGSYQVGFHYNCVQARGCDYLELNSPIALGAAGDPTQLHSARWIRGGKEPGEQMVKGGEGALAIFGGGQEPTGRHPFGEAVKVVLTETDESKGLGRFSLYFRVCHHGIVDLGCTPYILGPIPFYSSHEKGMVLVGLTQTAMPDGIQQPDTPTDIQNFINQKDSGGGIGSIDSSGNPCGTLPGSVNEAALAQAIKDEESSGGNYTIINGPQYDPRTGEAIGTAIGAYQFMNYNDDAVAIVSKVQPTADFPQSGKQWLDSLYSHSATPAEINHYFPKAAQDQAFDIAVKRESAQFYQQGLRGDAVVECVAETWISGGCRHSGVQDGNGTSDSAYGGNVLRYYHQRLSQGVSCPVAGNGTNPTLKSQYVNPLPGLGTGSPFGNRTNLDTGVGTEFHPGIDIPAEMNTPIHSVNTGTVVYTVTNCPSNSSLDDHCGNNYGNMVIVAQPNGYQIVYSHLSSVNVKPGQPVSQGQILGGTGSSGRSTGPHLFLEVDRVHPGVDPNQGWLPGGSYDPVDPQSIGIPLGQ